MAAKKTIIHMVATRCPPEMAARFDEWYNTRHVPDLLKFPRLKRVTRYRSLHPDNGFPRFIAAYEFESREDFEAYFNSPERAIAGEDWKKAQKKLGASQDWAVQWEFIGTWQK